MSGKTYKTHDGYEITGWEAGAPEVPGIRVALADVVWMTKWVGSMLLNFAVIRESDGTFSAL